MNQLTNLPDDYIDISELRKENPTTNLEIVRNFIEKFYGQEFVVTDLVPLVRKHPDFKQYGDVRRQVYESIRTLKNQGFLVVLRKETIGRSAANIMMQAEYIEHARAQQRETENET